MLTPKDVLGAEVGTDSVVPGPDMRQCFHLLLQVPLWPWSETANTAVSERSFCSTQFAFTPWPIQQGNTLITALWISGLEDFSLIKTAIQSCLEISSRRNRFSIQPVASQWADNITSEMLCKGNVLLIVSRMLQQCKSLWKDRLIKPKVGGNNCKYMWI